MKRNFLALALLVALVSCAQQKETVDWAPAGDRILTEWGENLDVNNVLPEYPRPQMVRKEWVNLNGFWDFATCDTSGNILVPFPLESALSGVGIGVGEDARLTYNRKFNIPSKYLRGRVLLHCGGIDCYSKIFINGSEAASHIGGYTAINADITQWLKKGENEIRIEVEDRTEKDIHAVGKQRVDHSGIWYTSVTGIWQTIWLEPVPESYIDKLTITPYLDLSTICVNVDAEASNGEVEVKIMDGAQTVAAKSGKPGEEINIKLDNPKLWSPDDPFLYDVKVTLKDNGVKTDEVASYAAMRKVSADRDADGTLRIMLNGKPVFCFGPLDQGWWPDGLYTAPTDEALAFDIIRTKELGYNTIRKHVKVEPERWYYHCDRLGMLVWQDMPNGDNWTSPKWDGQDDFLEGSEPEPKRSEVSRDQYWKDWTAVMDQLHNHPSIIVWVPFNEAWGQFNTIEVATRTKLLDPTRLVNPASGGNLFPCGDIIDFHNYSYDPLPRSHPHPDYVVVVGEFGGIGMQVPEHTWTSEGWGYRDFESESKVLNDRYVSYVTKIIENVDSMAISGAIYTQTTDVETELNGFYTYDRKVLKFDEARFTEINKRLSHIFD